MVTNTKPLKQWSTDELETAIQSGYFDKKSEAERILREREREPDRKLARRTYNAAAWARAYSEGTFIVALIILWLLATGEWPATTSEQPPRQPAEAAEPETSLLAAPPIETAKPETSSLAVPPITAPQRGPAPTTDAAKPETSPSVAPSIETAEPEALPSAAPTGAAPAEAPLASPDAHPAEAVPATASPQEPLATPTPANAASTEAQPTAPAADVTAPSRQRTSSRLRQRLSAPREATDAWKKGVNIFGR
jgi:hypothetical protein